MEDVILNNITEIIIAIITVIAAIGITVSVVNRKNKMKQKSGNNSTNIQIGGDFKINKKDDEARGR